MKRYIKSSENNISLESIKKQLRLMDSYDLLDLYQDLVGDYLTFYDEDLEEDVIDEEVDFDLLAKSILQLKEEENLESDNAYDLVNEVKFYI